MNGLWVLPLLFAVLLLFVFSLGNVRTSQDENACRQLEDTIRRSAVTCYALEGVYPPALSYLEEHYGLVIDGARYAVFYEVFAENMMPDITVVRLD